MKNNILLIIAIIYVFAFLTGCSIDNQIEDSEPETIVEIDHQETAEGKRELANVTKREEPNPEELGAFDENRVYHLAIVVNFIDIKLQSAESEWAAFFYGDSESVKQYYDNQTDGKVVITPAKESFGDIDNGVIIVDADMMHPDLDAAYLMSSDEERQDSFFEEVMLRADPYIDFGDYDKDGDTAIRSSELVITIVAAGYEDDPNYIFDEKAVQGVSISQSTSEYRDNVTIRDFLMVGEVHFDYEGNEIFPTIGVVCHEVGHALGLPDLYDTDLSSEGLSFHALMASGSSNTKQGEPMGKYPAPLIAWSKEYLNLIEPEQITVSGEYDLYARSTDAFNVLKIIENGHYYLLENVDFDGFGIGLNSMMEEPGIAVWRIDVEKTLASAIRDNTVNTDENQRGVSLIEAGGTRDLYEAQLDYYRDDYNHYFSKSNGKTFTTEEGTVINFLTKPGDIMRVEILLAVE